MAQIGITIESINFNGESVDITFNPFSGGSINLGTQTIPYDYLSTNYEGNYSIYIPSVPKTCGLTVGTPPSPTPSPTSSVTPSVTPSITPTITPTASVTVTPTPSVTITPTPSASVPAGDADANAYIAAIIASGGTADATTQDAIQTLFTDLKTAGVYSKIFAFYPVVGGTSSSHAINANRATAYDLTFAGGWTHDVSGMTSNGSNAYADTNVTPQDLGTAGTGLDNHHMLSSLNQLSTLGYEGAGPSPYMAQRHGALDFLDAQSAVNLGNVYSTGTVDALQLCNRVGNTSFHGQYQIDGGPLTKTNTNLNSAISITSNPAYIGRISGAGFYVAKRCNFWSLGDGLTDTEVADFFAAINKFNSALGRNRIDAEADAYLADVVTSGGTVDATTTTAVRTLFSDLKQAGVYSKLNNFYPMVGGVAGSHAINGNLNKTYDLTFTGGWVHDASGSTSNGTNAYADTSYQPFSETTASSVTFGYYNHLYTTSTGEKYNGSLNNVSPQEWLGFRNSTTSSNRIHIGTSNTTQTVNTGQQGMFISSTNSSNQLIFHYNGSLQGTAGSVSGPLPDWSVYMGALNLNGSGYGYVDMGFSFFFNSNYRLTSTELTDLADAINDFQTTMGRNTY